MKNLQVILPKWSMKMPWVQGVVKTFSEDYNLTFSNVPHNKNSPDAFLFMWCDKATKDYINTKPLPIPIIVVMRRYEFYTGEWNDIKWDRVDHLFFVNGNFRKAVVEAKPDLEEKSSVVYNIFDPDRFTFRERGHGRKIAMVGHVNQRKNLSMALQIMAELPNDYELHLAGSVQSIEVMVYLDHLAKKLRRRIHFHSNIPPENMNRWLDDKNYLLHTSVSEGNPNSVIEAMAKGIKPAIHEYPGAADQFPQNMVFGKISEAVNMLSHESMYDSQVYRHWADSRFSLDNLSVIKNKVDKLCTLKQLS